MACLLGAWHGAPTVLPAGTHWVSSEAHGFEINVITLNVQMGKLRLRDIPGVTQQHTNSQTPARVWLTPKPLLDGPKAGRVCVKLGRGSERVGGAHRSAPEGMTAGCWAQGVN